MPCPDRERGNPVKIEGGRRKKRARGNASFGGSEAQSAPPPHPRASSGHGPAVVVAVRTACRRAGRAARLGVQRAGAKGRQDGRRHEGETRPTGRLLQKLPTI